MNINDNAGAGNPESQGATQNAPEQAPQVLDLDGVSTFKFQGETLTPDQLAEIKYGYSKYGEVSKYVEEDQKYWNNVEHDIEKVLKNPQRAEEFKQVYPERFHRLLDRALGQTQRGNGVQSETSQQLPREVGEKLSAYEARLRQFEERAFQADVAAAQAKIDAILPKLLDKYELADQDKVLFEAEKLLSKGGKLTDSAWERLVREDHERTSKRADKFYKAKVDTQIKTGQRGADSPPGGVSPGNAPVKHRTIADAREALIDSLKKQGYR